jgi:hypothetical protein
MDDNQKASRRTLVTLSTPQLRAFRTSWIAFFLCVERVPCSPVFFRARPCEVSPLEVIRRYLLKSSAAKTVRAIA